MYILQINLPPSLQAISELLGVELEFGQIGSLNSSSKGTSYIYVCVNILLEREGILVNSWVWNSSLAKLGP
jgi:hypothetical protein